MRVGRGSGMPPVVARFLGGAVIALVAAGCGGTSGGNHGNGAASRPTAEVAKTWPDKWCQADSGMSRKDMRTLMGPPSDEVTQAQASSNGGDPQMSWDYAEYQFNAFFDVNDRVRQLDVNDIDLT